MFVFANIILVLLGVQTLDNFLIGFSNRPILAIFLLIIASLILKKAFDIESLIENTFSKSTNYKSYLLKMTAFVAAMSSFFNNTPVVALLIPSVCQWGKKNKIQPSKLLIPLSYAAILGGMMTIIGTSTNLVLNGFLLQSGIEPFGFFDFLPLGLLVSVGCIGFIVIFGENLLPNKRDVMDEFETTPKDYLVETRIATDSHLIGKTIREANLRGLKGVYLIEIIRNKEKITPVAGDIMLQDKDSLIFAGNVGNIMDLVHFENGIELPNSSIMDEIKPTNVIEAIIPANSYLGGILVKDSNFRERFNAAIIAIHRNGERVIGSTGKVRLEFGDLLLISVGENFNSQNVNRDLHIISKIKNEQKPNSKTVKGFLWMILALLGLTAANVIPFFVFLMVLVGGSLLIRLLNMDDLKRAIDYNLLAILVSALAFGEVMIKSGAAHVLTDAVLWVVGDSCFTSLTIGLFFLTVLLTSFVTNVAAISIMFPIALGLSTNLELDGKALYMSIAFAASAAFITPFGYQTNMMVMNPGNYISKDFMKIGLPLTFIYFCICIGYLSIVYKP